MARPIPCPAAVMIAILRFSRLVIVSLEQTGVKFNLTAPIRPSREAQLFTPKTVQYLISRAAHLEETKSPNALHRELPHADPTGEPVGQTCKTLRVVHDPG